MAGASFEPHDLVLQSTKSVTDLLGALEESDWDRTIDTVGWSCRFTIEHIGGDYLHYAGQVAQQPEGHYVSFSFDQSRAKTHALLVEGVSMAGRLLAAAVSWAPSTSSAWHPQGNFTPDAFAAMAACEALVHGHDIASSLQLGWQPDDDLSRHVVGTFFPAVPVSLAESHGPFEVLLWATGRRSIPGVADVSDWDYRAALRP